MTRHDQLPRTTTDVVILAGARTPQGRLNGQLAGFTAVELGAKAIAAALDVQRRQGRPGGPRHHGPGAAGRSRPEPGPAERHRRRHRLERARRDHQQGLPLRPHRRDRRRPDDPQRRRHRRGGRRPGIHDPGPARAARLPAGLDVRRRPGPRRRRPRRAHRRLRRRVHGAVHGTQQHAPWASTAPPRTRWPPPRTSGPLPAQPRTASSTARSSPSASRSARATRWSSPPTRASGPRPRVESLAPLRPASSTDGTITAGNSSPLSDGAAALVLTSRTYRGGARPGLARRRRQARPGRRAGQLPALPALQRHPERPGQGRLEHRGPGLHRNQRGIRLRGRPVPEGPGLPAGAVQHPRRGHRAGPPDRGLRRTAGPARGPRTQAPRARARRPCRCAAAAARARRCCCTATD